MQNNLKDLSYALGMNVAQSLKSQQFTEIDLEAFTEAFDAVLEGRDLRMDDEQANQSIQVYLQEKQKERFTKNLEEGTKFLAQNGQREVVKTTDSGLQYEILTEGSGENPVAHNEVTVHYHGTLINGEVFDSSYQRGTPATFGLNQVIRGWTEGLQLMNKGSKFRFYIPQELAYGANPRPGGPIEPYSALIFDVELLEIR
jgi:FKBP-type peptidyl-prolyl cis-trans isomerase